MNRDYLLDIARTLVTELEQNEAQLNPNDVSNVADELGGIADSLDYFDQNSVAEVNDEARNLAYQIRELRDTVESWVR